MISPSWVRMLCETPQPEIRAKVGHSVFLQNKDLKSIPINQDFKRAETIDLSHNSIKDFKKLPNSRVTTELFVNNTNITSFKHAPDLPRLVRISLENTPAASLEHLNVMVLIAFNCAVYFINNKTVEDEDLLYMYRNGGVIRDYIRNGYILTSRDPIILQNPDDGTHKELGPANKTKEIHLNEGQSIKDFMFEYVGSIYRDIPSIPAKRLAKNGGDTTLPPARNRQSTSRAASPFKDMETLSFNQFIKKSSSRSGSLPKITTSMLPPRSKS